MLIRGANFDHEYGETYLGEGPPNSPTEYIHAGLTPKLDLGPYFGRGGPFHSCPGKWAMAGKKMSVGLEMCRSQLPKKKQKRFPLPQCWDYLEFEWRSLVDLG